MDMEHYFQVYSVVIGYLHTLCGLLSLAYLTWHKHVRFIHVIVHIILCLFDC